MYPSFWAQFHDFLKPRFIGLPARLISRLSLPRSEALWRNSSGRWKASSRVYFTTFLRFSPADFLVTKKQKHLLRVLLFLITRTLN